MKQIKSLIVVLLLSVLIIPSVALAAWWNPFSWSVWNAFKNSPTTPTPVMQNNQTPTNTPSTPSNPQVDTNTTTQDTISSKQNDSIPANKLTLKNITDSNFGIEIKVPTSWVKLQYPSGMQNTSVGFKKGFQKFEIIKQSLSNVSFDSFSKIWLTTQKNVISSTNVNIDGKNAIKVIRDNSSSVDPKAITIFIDGGDKSYQLDWLMEENYFDNSQNEINQVLNSIHFTK